MIKIKTLKASSIRGIPKGWPELSVDDKGLVIYGPNGVGKSSIIDALEFTLRGQSSLFPENRQGVNWETACSHVIYGDPEVTIDIKDGQDTFSISSSLDISGLTAEQQKWVLSCRRSNFVFRRHMLLSFILQQPRNRYLQLEPFLNLEGYLPIENAFKDRSDGLETNIASLKANLSAIETKLSGIFGKGIDISEDALLYALNEKLKFLEIAECADLAQLNDTKNALSVQMGGDDKTERLGGLASLKAKAQRLGVAHDNLEPLKAVIEARENVQREVADRTDEVLTDFYLRGKEIVEKSETVYCPLCEQPIEREAILRRLQERIQADERITAAKSLYGQRINVLKGLIAALIAAYGEFINEWEGHVNAKLPKAYTNTKDILLTLHTLLEQTEADSKILREISDQIKATPQSHENIIKQLEALIQSEGGVEKRQGQVDSKLMIEALQSDWEKHKSISKELSKCGTEKQLFDRLHGHAVEARKQTVQKVVNVIARTANEFYEFIHPGERISTSELNISHRGQGSLELTSGFHGVRVNPMLHHSESHLDTLGLSYFLALRWHEARNDPTFKVLIIDDVLTSVDGQHRQRITSLIDEKFSDHQIVISTHDFHFYEHIKRIFGNAGYKYVAFNGWDIEKGPYPSDPSTDIDVLDVDKRSSMNHQDLASRCGRFFEWYLKQVTESLQISVPARFNFNHDIGNLWPALCSKIKKNQGFQKDHSSLADDLDNNIWVRNACGAHSNEEDSPVDPREVTAFAEKLEVLHKATYCNSCKKFICKKNGDDWACTCGKQHYEAHVKMTASS